MPKKDNVPVLTPLLAFILAALIPGAGHLYLRKTVRGIIIFLAITAMFWGGVAMGGVFTMDLRNEPWWSRAQLLTGLNGAIQYHRQEQMYANLAEGIRQDKDVKAEIDRSERSLHQLRLEYDKVARELKIAKDQPDQGKRVKDLTEQQQKLMFDISGKQADLAHFKLDYLDGEMAREGLALTSPTDNVARAYAGVAGLMNLLCVFDALMLGLLGSVGEKLPPDGEEATA